MLKHFLHELYSRIKALYIWFIFTYSLYIYKPLSANTRAVWLIIIWISPRCTKKRIAKTKIALTYQATLVNAHIFCKKKSLLHKICSIKIHNKGICISFCYIIKYLLYNFCVSFNIMPAILCTRKANIICSTILLSQQLKFNKTCFSYSYLKQKKKK